MESLDLGGRVNRAYLSIDTDDLGPDAISTMLGRRADRGWQRGALRRFGSGTYAYHRWVFDLAVPGRDHFGTRELSEAIAGLGADLAAGCAALRSRGADVTLQVVQAVRPDDDGGATGIHLNRQALAWLTAARAEVDIDQYFFVEGELQPTQTQALGGNL